MTNPTGQRSNRAKRFLLASAGVGALIVPLVIGVGDAPAIRAESRAVTVPMDSATQTATALAPVQLAFDAASIKPHTGFGGGGRNGGAGGGPPVGMGGGNLRFTPGRVVSGPVGVTARKVILEAFHLTQYQLSGGAGWLDSDRFDLEAKAEGANENQLRQMLQALLVERFKLVVHRETKEMPVYALMVGKNGTKLHEWKEGDPLPAFGSGGHPNNFRDRGTMQRLADVLSGGPAVGRPVLDKTGLKGVYVFYVEWDADEDFLPAMQQLGLKLESQKGPVDILAIDRIEKPGAN